MRILDVVLLCLVSVLLMNASYSFVESLFANANSWIPSVFSDTVEWHPGKTFYWGLCSVLGGLFLCRFAVRPVFTAALVALIMITINLTPSIESLGLTTTLTQLFSSYQTAQDQLQLLGLFTVITWLVQWFIKPDREHEVIEED